MSISGISSSSLVQLGTTGASYFSQIKDAWQSLQSSLQSGDTDTAKKAVATIQALQTKYQSLFSSSDSTTSTTQFDTDLQTLSDALDDGDLSAAKTAFSSLKTDFEGQRQQFASQMQAAAQVANQDAVMQLLGVSDDSDDDSTNLLDILSSSNSQTVEDALNNLKTTGTKIDVEG